MDQIRKFGEQTSLILEFKPEGLEGYILQNQRLIMEPLKSPPRSIQILTFSQMFWLFLLF